MKKNILAVVFFALLLPFCIKAQPGFITVKGKDVIGPDGKPFIMRGTNLGNWLIPEGYMFKFDKTNSPRLINEAITELIGPGEAKKFWEKYLHNYITEGDIHYLKSIGVNSIRIPFNYRLFTSEDYLGANDPNRGFELIDPVISWCKKEGIYVILDMHAAPGGQTGDNIDDGYGYPFLFKSEASQKQCAEIWARIAGHYKNEPIIIGYDLLNEPIATYFDAGDFNPSLEPVYKLITAAIRTVDKNHIVILGGAQWDSNFKPFGPPFDAKLIYQFHKYWTDPTKAVIQDYIDFRDKYNVPIYCGETGENKDEWVKQFKDVLEQNNIGWHYWPYKKMENLSGFVTFDKPANYDKIIEYAAKQRSSFEDIRKVGPVDREQVKKALYDFIENSRFEHCRVNKGYVGALGFKTN
ncbi:glycoside hydrolase family 5 protein [Mucilaginibacter ginsenosidivorans]|uniref:Cellulase family glycosylhydrolase n=1 Tax=Mucilaginibacter ginsenosidivorans TaxID=398053 RepID=A0A5B8UQH3_9SPHI|nr:cellulase family glycosylhydrolase [Mucilaginibacter ginsenosidivorans]QEC61327.1 cellulase family glycosylhydrolase [Mucilaginibacter ginsenosidivorans]